MFTAPISGSPNIFDQCVSSVLIIGEHDLGNAILRDYLDDHLDCVCDITSITETYAVTNGSRVVLLVDYRSLNGSAARHFCRNCRWRRKTTLCALFNVPRDHRVEDFLSCTHLRGVFFADTHPGELIRGIRGMLEGLHWIPRDVLVNALSRLPPSKPLSDHFLDSKRITSRERHVLHMVESGATNIEIASKLHLSEHTIKTHIYNIFRKLGVSNRVQAINLVRSKALMTIDANR